MVDNINESNYNTKKNQSNHSNRGNDIKLVLFNDDTNTFEFVIDSLVEFCNLGTEAAEQLTLLAHYRGNITVKEGPESLLIKMQSNLQDIGINAELL